MFKMNILSSSLAKNQRVIGTLSRSLFPTKLIRYCGTRFNHSKDEDRFGIGSKYAELDSKAKKNFFQENAQQNLEKIEDKFGNLSTTQQNQEFKHDLEFVKPLHKSNVTNLEEVEQEYDKILGHIRLSNDQRPNNEQYYANKINELVNSCKIKEAIDVFFVEMIEKDRFKPTLWLYKTLMRALGKHGYTHMVFELFKKITSSNDDDWNDSKNITKLHQIITILFQSCSTSPWKEYSIRKCDSIRFYLKNRQIMPNSKNYAAMISAYGKAGAIYEAFNAVDEMVHNKLKPNTDIINNLLCACISQPNYGFRYALMVWQTGLKLKIKPDLNSFNLMLKAAKDCGMSLKKDKMVRINYGAKAVNENRNIFPLDSHDFKQFSDDDFEFLSKNSTNYQNEPDHELICLINKNTNEKIDQEADFVVDIKENEIHVIDDLKLIGKALEDKIKNLEWWQDIKSNVDKTELLKGLSNFRPEIKNLILTQNFDSLLTRFKDNLESEVFDYVTDQMDSSQGHLDMLGGLQGLLKSMSFHAVKPDFKTFNLIVQVLPNDLESEHQVLNTMEQFAISPNIDFINLIIKRRMLRNEKFQIDEAFELIQKNSLSPNIITFGCLAYGIKNYDLLVQFLNDMKEAGFTLNPVIMTTLYSTGRFKKDTKYLSYLFSFINDQKLKIDQKLIDKIEFDIELIKKNLIKMEKSVLKTSKEQNYYAQLNKFYNSFKKLYSEWIQDAKMEKYQHPYAKFARNDDKLYQNFVKKTEQFEANKL